MYITASSLYNNYRGAPNDMPPGQSFESICPSQLARIAKFKNPNLAISAAWTCIVTATASIGDFFTVVADAS